MTRLNVIDFGIGLGGATAAFRRRGHRVGFEWRYFATRDEVRCRHFYWPEDSIRFDRGVPEPKDWRDELRGLAALEPPEDLGEMAMAAARACPHAEAWSVDFAKDDTGQWWLIDMALAERSFHVGHEGEEAP